MEGLKDISYELWILLNRTRYLIGKERQKELDRYGLSSRQAGVLYTTIRLGGKSTLKQLAKDLFLELHSVSELLKRMENRGFIKRVKDKTRGNLVTVEITKKGYEVVYDSRKQESIKDVMSVLDNNEKIELWSSLSKLRKRAMERRGLDETGIFPPFDYKEL